MILTVEYLTAADLSFRVYHCLPTNSIVKVKRRMHIRSDYYKYIFLEIIRKTNVKGYKLKYISLKRSNDVNNPGKEIKKHTKTAE